jgi:hypothetical protein
MSARIVKGLFASEEDAAAAVRAMQSARIDLGSISVIANIDEFRTVSTDLAGRLDKFVLACGVVLGIIGGIIGFTFAAHSTVNGSFLLVVPLMATLCGVVAGAYLGLVIGTVVDFDRPIFKLPVQEGRMSEGKVVVSARTETMEERYKIEAIMEEHGAIDIDSHVVGEPVATLAEK